MRMTISSTAELGLIVRAVRRSGKTRLEDLASIAGLSKQFTSDVEHGKPTVQLSLVLKLLAELGIPFELDVPQQALQELDELRRKMSEKNVTGQSGSENN